MLFKPGLSLYSGSLLSRAVRVVLKRTHGSAAYACAPASAPHEYRVGSSGRMPPLGGLWVGLDELGGLGRACLGSGLLVCGLCGFIRREVSLV